VSGTTPQAPHHRIVGRPPAAHNSPIVVGTSLPRCSGCRARSSNRRRRAGSPASSDHDGGGDAALALRCDQPPHELEQLLRVSPSTRPRGGPAARALPDSSAPGGVTRVPRIGERRPGSKYGIRRRRACR
jgi:hypothetical protein